MSMTSNYITVLEREIHYTEWGGGKGTGNVKTIVMWHGLARTGRDFDDIARHFASHYRVICPDTLGRGLSQWSPLPEKEYCLDFYAELATALVDVLGIAAMHWIGTSMGGAIGTVAAAGPLKGRINKLVLNDIGPSLAPPAIARIRGYAGNPPQFERVSELEAYFRTIYKPYGWLSDAQWRRLTETSTRRLPDGKVTPHYDPRMVFQFMREPDDYARWPEYDNVTAATLCLRGAESDLLLAETAQEMTRRGPRCQLATLPGIGHAPALNVPEQIRMVEEFLA
jgi:pimeloyl-ACP methyl ester carboxylesterase